MKSLEKEYFSDRRAKVFWAALFISIFWVFVLGQVYIPMIVGGGSRVHVFFDCLIGFFWFLIISKLTNSISNPKIRICDHFLIFDYDTVAMNWSKIRSVAIKGTSLLLETQKDKLTVKRKASISCIPEREELINDVEKICKEKGIPFEKQ
jgi:hypothetical protein